MMPSIRDQGGRHGCEVRAVPGQGRRVPLPAEGRNGEIIAVSESYSSKAGARNGIESVKTNAPPATVDDQTI
jgi:uncharacterized protein YegP (UPF0339 family)